MRGTGVVMKGSGKLFSVWIKAISLPNSICSDIIVIAETIQWVPQVCEGQTVRRFRVGGTCCAWQNHRYQLWCHCEQNAYFRPEPRISLSPLTRFLAKQKRISGSEENGKRLVMVCKHFKILSSYERGNIHPKLQSQPLIGTSQWFYISLV
jgi:hypothetical protein